MNKENVEIDSYIDLLKKVLTASIYEESGWAVIDVSDGRERPPGAMQYVRDRIRNFMVRQFRSKSLLLVKHNPLDSDARDEGRDWPLFGFTMAGHRRLDNVQMCVENVLANKVQGDFIETGAWRGGTTIFMRALLKAHGITDRNVWVADSFEGLPAPKDKDDGTDLSRVDYLKVSLEQVMSNFEKFDLLDEQVKFLKGWFCDTLPDAPITELAILRLDGDMYSSTMDSLNALYHKVNKGGYVIVDDYYSWPSCKRAVSDFRSKHGINSEIVTIDWTGAYWQVE